MTWASTAIMRSMTLYSLINHNVPNSWWPVGLSRVGLIVSLNLHYRMYTHSTCLWYCMCVNCNRHTSSIDESCPAIEPQYILNVLWNCGLVVTVHRTSITEIGKQERKTKNEIYCKHKCLPQNYWMYITYPYEIWHYWLCKFADTVQCWEWFKIIWFKIVI